MDKTVLDVKTITEYNDALELETLHPLVAVVDLSKAKPMKHAKRMFSFYTVFLKDEKNCDILYGRRSYDYQKGSIICLAPGQVIGTADTGEVYQPKGWVLCFHPDLINGTSLSRNMKEYSYFSYEVNEALHVSERERLLFLDCLDKIQHELEHSIDRLSKRLIINHIETLLDYCLRFYERQFVTRTQDNQDILARFEYLLDDYFFNGTAKQKGLPTVKYCASEFRLSPNYFGDLIKKETGKTAQEYIHLKLIEAAKNLVLIPDKTISEIAYDLGFQYPQHFSRLFKKLTGYSPNEYRVIN